MSGLRKSLDAVGFTVDREHEREGVPRAVSMRAGDVRVLTGHDDGSQRSDRTKGEGFSLTITTAHDSVGIARQIDERGGRLEADLATTPGVCG